MEGLVNLPPQLSAEAEQLIQAVEIALSPTASADARTQAYSICERFKEESPLCAAVGLQLVCSNITATIQHFGLQLVEHCIKFQWQDIHPQQKLSIKDSVWNLMSTGFNMAEPSYIKDGTAKLVVEMVKREWPQQWPTFLQELTSLATRGNEYQIELVLLVLLRLVEDVAVFQSVDATRRRDLQQALTANMSDIFDFLLELLRMQVTFYNERKSTGAPEAVFNSRLAQSVIAVFQAHVEWVSINHIMAHDGQLLVLLCNLLSEENFRLPSADCLLQIVSRKGSAKERVPLLILFIQGAIESMLKAAELASSQPLTENNYSFLKRLTEVLVGMGTQLCSLYGKEPEVTKPDTFALYLQAFLALTRHPSLSINQTAASLWVALFRHEHLSTQPELVGIIEHWIAVVARKLVKTSVCAYDQMDFDSDEEFTAFHLKLRSDLLESVRLATLLAPAVTFPYAQQWLLSQLESPSPVLVEWEALSFFLDAVANRAKEAPTGSQLLERCLTYQSNDPLILSELLSFISALFTFAQNDPARLVQPVLDRIFAALVLGEPGEQTKDGRSKNIRDLRRHACSLLVKISLQIPVLLAQQFNYIKANVERLCQIQDDRKLSRMEIISLQESLLIISNQFANFQMQSDFVSEVVRPAAERWAVLGPAFNSAQEFLSLIGFDRPLVESSSEDVGIQNRSELLACTHLFQTVLKRCRPSNDGSKEHPAANHMAPLLFHTFRLARVLHQLWEPEARNLLSPCYAKVYDLLDSEKLSILTQGGIGQSAVVAASTKRQTNHSPLEKAQNFFAQIHNNVYIMLGLFGETFGEQFYSQPGLALAVAGTACYGLEHISDHRLRTVIRSFFRPFITSCPANMHQPVMLPFLAHLFPVMLQKLSGRWQETMQQHHERSPSDENQADTQEILQDISIRFVTRDYIDVIKLVLLSVSSQTEETEEMMDAENNPSSTHSAASISELGKVVLFESSLSSPVLQCLLNALWWPDTTNSIRAGNILQSVIKYWAGLLPRNSAHFPNSEVASMCLCHVLNGMQLLGQHDANLAALIHLGVLMYDTFLPIYPAAMSELMIRHAGCTKEDADQYQDKAASLANSGHRSTQKVDKAKRDLFRKMTSQIVGQHLADLFRKPVQLPSLPKMNSLKPRQKSNAIDLGDAGLGDLFEQD